MPRSSDARILAGILFFVSLAIVLGAGVTTVQLGVWTRDMSAETQAPMGDLGDLYAWPFEAGLTVVLGGATLVAGLVTLAFGVVGAMLGRGAFGGPPPAGPPRQRMPTPPSPPPGSDELPPTPPPEP